MTEIYHGPWNPVTGDKPKTKSPDVYHRYPTSGKTRSEVNYDKPVKAVLAEQDVAQPK